MYCSKSIVIFNESLHILIYIYIYIYIQKLMIWRKAIFPNHVMKINILIVCFQSGLTLLQMLRSWIGQMRSRDHEHSFEKIFANSDTIIIIDSSLDLDSFPSVSCSLFFFFESHVDHWTIMLKNICIGKGNIDDISRFFQVSEITSSHDSKIVLQEYLLRKCVKTLNK